MITLEVSIEQLIDGITEDREEFTQVLIETFPEEVLKQIVESFNEIQDEVPWEYWENLYSKINKVMEE